MSKETNIGDSYHLGTKYYRERKLDDRSRLSKMPEVYKTYPGAETVSLPKPDQSSGKPIWDLLSHRRSIRNYAYAPVSVSELSQLLWSIQGVTAHIGHYDLRTAPSAGALYPIETYVLINRVSDLSPGIYHYDVRQHSLEVIREGDFGMDLAYAALGQTMLQEAALVFIWTAVIARSKWKYADRAYRYIYMDAGHIGQNAYLAAEALGLGCCAVGAFFDDEVDSVIGIDGKDEISVYLCAIGRK